MESRSRTVVVSGVPAALSPDRMADKLTVHFQRVRRSDGGDVEEVKYPTSMDGVAFVTFHKAEDASRVVRKKEQVMKDDEFPEDYTLTVFPFSTDVFLYVSTATLDLLDFGSDQTNLIESLSSAHRSIRFRPSPKQREVLIEGPLSAVKTLREDLIRRAKDPKPSVQTAAVKLKDSSSNLRGTTHPEVVGSAGFSGTKAKQRPLGLSKVWNSGEVQDSFSKSETQKVLFMQNVSNESSAGERRRHVTGEESKPGTVVLSGQELDPVKEKSAKPQRKGSFSERISAENHLDLSSSATGTNFSQTKFGDTSTEGIVDPEDVEETWADLYTFTYIHKFHKKELMACWTDVNMATEYIEGTGLLKISLTKNSRTGSRSLKTALDKLETLMENWAVFLRVHEISYDKSLMKRTLTVICDEANSFYRDVLYMFEDSQIKVIGPSKSGHLFCLMVEDKMSKALLKKLKAEGKKYINKDV